MWSDNTLYTTQVSEIIVIPNDIVNPLDDRRTMPNIKINLDRHHCIVRKDTLLLLLRTCLNISELRYNDKISSQDLINLNKILNNDI